MGLSLLLLCLGAFSITTAVSQSLTTSIYTYTATATLTLQSTFTARGRVRTTDVGVQYSVYTSTASVVTTLPATTTLFISTSPASRVASSLRESSASQSHQTAHSKQTLPPNASTSSATSSSVSNSASSGSFKSSSSTNALSGGARVGIAMAAALVVGGVVAVFVVVIYRRARRSYRFGQPEASHSSNNENEQHVFSTSVGPGFIGKSDSTTQLVGDKREKQITEQRFSPISHESDATSRMGANRPSMSPVNNQIEKQQPPPESVRSSHSITALPRWRGWG